ncbi:M-phase-specific PLK1-interacting protein [Halichoeres trimaculatus]|uniref:M-phase-specific PLK1-interacting protein n=1 Tax=Halichoeres trimaculatus TaxID=147232 RepID=UPI003D9E1BD1
MYRAPVRPQRSPGAPRPPGRLPSPSSCWGFPGARSPYGGSGPRAGSPRGGPAYAPGSPVYSPPYSPASSWGYREGSPGGFGSGARGSGGHMWRGGRGFRRPQSFSPSAHLQQSGSSDAPVEKYFSPAMLQDPWAALQPVAVTKS